MCPRRKAQDPDWQQLPEQAEHPLPAWPPAGMLRGQKNRMRSKVIVLLRRSCQQRAAEGRRHLPVPPGHQGRSQML